MHKQVYSNHTRWVPMYHFYGTALLVLLNVLTIINLVNAIQDGGLFQAVIIEIIAILCILIGYFSRAFALKAQDRAIRAEENLRHFVMTGKLQDSRLTIRQRIGLRFASDEEYLALSVHAAEQNIDEQDIKKSVKNWRGDYERA